MVRHVCAILFLTVTGVAVVQLRWAQNASHAEMYRLEAQRLKVRRVLWAQQLQLNSPALPSPSRAADPVWAIELAAPGAPPRPQRYLVQRD